MTRSNVVVVLLVVAAACSKSSSSGGGSGAAGGGGGECAKVIGKTFEKIVKAGIQQGAAQHGGTTPEVQAEIDKMSGEMMKSVEPVKAAMIQACNEDHWSADALKCVGDVETGDQLDRCNTKLTSAQDQHLEKLIAEAQAKPVAGVPPACNRYADLEIKCSDAGEGARPTILDFCTKARAGAKDATYQLIKLESTCAETATDCDDYKSCVEKKKAETTPE